ncbi:hypothetical protein L6R52_18100 [Myxococcota bacterium]|nr:hypothetical protein [Myxococcota bacterium]
MALDIFEERGVPIDRQELDWSEMVRQPYSKLDDDAFTRVRVILMNGIEAESVRFSHACARMRADLQLPLARVRRVEHHQQTAVNWLNPGDQSPLETTLGFEQTAIEVTAHVAQNEPDDYLAQVYRFGMLEDFDHLYRFSSLMDRLYGKDANNITQSYTDIIPGRPTIVEHRAPIDDLRTPYAKASAAPITKLNALTIVAAEHMVHDYYMIVGPQFSDPLARQLYAEIASIEEQHVTQYESLCDPHESWLEKWLIHEATEVYNYYSCMQQETNPRIKQLWARFVDYELGHLTFVRELFQTIEGRDAAEILPAELPDPVKFESHRQFIRQTVDAEAGLRAVGPSFVDESLVPPDNPSLLYRSIVNRAGSPSETVAAGYRWHPGTELARVAGTASSASDDARRIQ